MRKNKVILNIIIGLALVLLIGILDGYRLSAVSISLDQDKNDHFTPSEVVSSNTKNGVTTVVTRHDSWIKCHAIHQVLGFLWKADPIKISPVNLNEPMIPQNETEFRLTYLNACEWAVYGIDPVLILNEVHHAAKAYMAEDYMIVNILIDRIYQKNDGELQVNGSILFTSYDKTVNSEYVLYFRNGPEWENYYSNLLVRNISVTQGVTAETYFKWYDTYFVPQGLTHWIATSLTCQDTLNDVETNFEHGKMQFIAKQVCSALGWTYVIEQHASAKFVLHQGWVFEAEEETTQEFLDLTGTYRANLYEFEHGGDDIFTTVNDLKVEGTLLYTVSKDYEVQIVSNTMTMEFTYMGKHYEGDAVFQVDAFTRRLTTMMDANNDSSFEFGIQLNYYEETHTIVPVFYARGDQYWGTAVKIK